MYHTQPDIWKDHLLTALKEDGWPWDWTTLGTLEATIAKKKANGMGSKKKQKGEIQAKIIAKSDGIWAAEGIVASLAQIVPQVRMENRVSDGRRFKAGDFLVGIQGSAREVLAWERPFLNLAAYASGIATATAALVTKVKKACPRNTPRVCLTRKTLPGFRDIAIHSVRIGGGYPHRVTLSGGVLIKENHIAAAKGIRNAIIGAREAAPHGLKIQIEVRSMDELKEALRANADGVLLDNFSPAQAQAALKYLKQENEKSFVEISGGLHEGNISDYAIEGVHVLSVGSITHSVKAVDLSLLVCE